MLLAYDYKKGNQTIMEKTIERRKLDTAVEREVYKFVSQIREHMYDHTMIYLNRHQVDVDRDAAERVLIIAKNAVDDGLMGKLDMFKEGVDKVLDEYADSCKTAEPPSYMAKKSDYSETGSGVQKKESKKVKKVKKV